MAWRPRTEQHEMRKTLIRSLLARARYTHEILDYCQQHEAFAKSYDADGNPVSYMARGSIRKLLYEVKAEIRNREINSKHELMGLLEQIDAAYRMGANQNDCRAMLAAVREKSRILGLRVSETDEGIDLDEVAEQVRAMDNAVVPPSETGGERDERQ